jgi:hypothetical protein
MEEKYIPIAPKTEKKLSGGNEREGEIQIWNERCR